MSRVAIVADNYKLDKFKEELKKAGINDFRIVPVKQIKNASSIKIDIEESRLMDIKKVCQIVELHFKHSN